MTTQERLDVTLAAFGDQREVLIVSHGVVYEGFVEHFYGGTISAVVRVAVGQEKSSRFKRYFTLDDIEDIAFAETEDPEPQTVFDIPPSNNIYGVESDHEAAELVRRSDNLVAEAHARKRLTPDHSTSDVLARAIAALTGTSLDAPPPAPHLPNNAEGAGGV
jgi:hypothetical protein